MNTTEILQHVHTVLLVDWPSRDVPESLARAGFTVFTKGGPAADDFWLCEWRDNQLAQQRTGCPPAHADLVYSFRPLAELASVIQLAKTVDAHTVWTQSGLCSDGSKDPRGCWLSHHDRLEACHLVQSAGLTHVSQPYIADVARQLVPVHQ